jgi:hypothetical protein
MWSLKKYSTMRKVCNKKLFTTTSITTVFRVIHLFLNTVEEDFKTGLKVMQKTASHKLL